MLFSVKILDNAADAWYNESHVSKQIFQNAQGGKESKMLTIRNLTKTYGEKRAVDNLSLHIAPGEIYGFIGHNGAGKTT